MKNRSRYRVRIVDEAHLVDKGGFSLSWKIIPVITVICIFFIAIGMGIIWLTPVKKYLPGYLRPEQRVKTEEAYLRIDSLRELYRVQEAYLDNLVKVLDSDREPDVADTVGAALPLIADSLMVSSEIEKEFMKKMEEAGYIITINQDYEDKAE